MSTAELPTIDSVLAQHDAGLSAPPEAGTETAQVAAAEAAAEAAEPPSSLPPVDADPSPQSAAPETTDRLLALMNEERQLREARQSVTSREAELESQRAQLESRAEELSKYQKLEEILLTRDAGALAEYYGMDPQELVESIQTGRGADPARLMEERFEARIAEMRKEMEEKYSVSETRHQERITGEAHAEIIRGLPELSPALAALVEINPGAANDILDSMRSHYKETREVPTLQQVIPGLQEETLGQAATLFRALGPHFPETVKQELRTLLGSAGEAGADRVSNTVAPQVTLTNEGTAVTTNITPNGDLPMDREAALDALLKKYGAG